MSSKGDTDFWKEITNSYPLGWQEFVNWYKSKHPAKFNHSDCWVLEITVNEIREFYKMKYGVALFPITTKKQIRESFKGMEGNIKETEEANHKFDEIFGGIEDVVKKSGIMDATGTEKIS